MSRAQETAAAQGAFYTIGKTGHGEYEEKKSRFLGEAIPVETPQEAAAELERIRKQYYDARHHCSAYVLGSRRDMKKASDDGEPSGTAGLPILKMIESLQCTNVIVVVTRYFGGILLGTGGLTRAYTAASRLALEDAGPVCMRSGEILELQMEYSLLNPVQHYLEKEAIQTVGMDYTDRVACRIVVPAPDVERVRAYLQTLSGGTMGVRTVESGFYGFENA